MINKDMVLENVSIEDACQVNGIEIRRGNQILCPAHPVRMGKPNTHYGNCLIYRDTNRFKCHSCGEAGNVITLTMDARSCSYYEALTFLAETLVPQAIEKPDYSSLKRTPKRCPISARELEMIGLKRSTAANPVCMADSVYSARHPQKDDPWSGVKYSILKDTNGNSGDVIMCRSESYTPLDLYREDQALFWEVVHGKASEALDFCKRTRRYGLRQFEDNAMIRDAYEAYLSEKESAANHILEVYGKTVNK